VSSLGLATYGLLTKSKKVTLVLVSLGQLEDFNVFDGRFLLPIFFGTKKPRNLVEGDIYDNRTICAEVHEESLIEGNSPSGELLTGVYSIPKIIVKP